MVEHILDYMKPLITERLDKVFLESKEYQELLEKEAHGFEQLQKGLTKEQKAQLDNYFNLVKSSAVFSEKLAYQQGMKDLLELMGGLVFNQQN